MRSNVETKKVLLTVKASPENSKKYGATLCTAGITDTGEWIRLYPVQYADIIRTNIPRYSWIEVECYKDSEHDLRKESYKIVPDTLRVVEYPRDISKGKPDWSYRNNLILPHISKSMADLVEQSKCDNTSLGLIKPVDIIDFYLETTDLNNEDYSQDMQMLLTGEKIPVLKKIPHYSYDFKCNGCCTESSCTSNGHHSSVCLDWEMAASFVKWKRDFPDNYESKMKSRYFDFMNSRDLYLFMGTHHIYKTWMIIGLYYPPKRQDKSLFEF
ncbi:MAG: hypothetical protein Q4Q53_02345 [Methanocorpusculum sp.]|nr:hypothetical protein [Methanocorpusculum sp.]